VEDIFAGMGWDEMGVVQGWNKNSAGIGGD